MKILHTADWHIGQFKGPVVDGVNLRLQDTVKCLEYMVEVARKRNLTLFAFLVISSTRSRLVRYGTRTK
ncbi:hypothetical protein DW723_02770 [Blautia obeum]|uniref:Nuclease SbcCD subunit D n=1 Tax=Blautia obeum TaxID=40520 RepID=A0A414KKN4_9FIRM|nr:hypothetical protein DW723_02770 [Blautia obeum]